MIKVSYEKKLENSKTKEDFLSLMPTEVLLAICDSIEPLKLLIIISSLSKKFYNALFYIIKQKTIDSLAINEIVSYRNSFFYLLANGDVFVCGVNDNAQLGDGSDHDDEKIDILPIKLPLTSISQMFTKPHNSNYFLTKTGKVFTCGHNEYGQQGIGNTEYQGLPIELELSNISQIATMLGDGSCTFFRTTTGEVFAYGQNQYGQLGVGDFEDRYSEPNKLSLPAILHVITQSGSTFFFTKAGKVFACGANQCGQLGIGNTEDQLLPVELPYLNFDKAVKIAKTWDIPTLCELTKAPGLHRQFFWHVLKEKVDDLNPERSFPKIG